MHATRERGFTLVEVTIAFAIFALCAAVLFEEFAGAQRRSAQARDREHSLLLAQSLLAQQRVAPPPWSARTAGSSEDGWTWDVQVAPFDAGVPPDFSWRAFLVTVRVWPAAAPSHEALLESVELARIAP
jgi:general secretion pathway protein I